MSEWLDYSSALSCLKNFALDNTLPDCSYLYDLSILKEHVMNIKNSLPFQVTLFYAVKANDQENILQALFPYVSGFEVASGGELQHVRNLFGGNSKVIFGGPAKTDAEHEMAVSESVDLIHIESIGELERLLQLAKDKKRRVSILLRVNIDIANTLEDKNNPMVMSGKPTPFGLQESDVNDCLSMIKKNHHVNCLGFHFHLLSLSRCHKSHLSCYDTCLQHVANWEKANHFTAKILNMGGGIGVKYYESQPDFLWQEYCAGFSDLIEKHQRQETQFILEMGRYISASCGFYCVEVIDIKKNHETFLVCRGGTHHFRLPVAQGHDHPFAVFPVEKWQRPYSRRGVSKQKVNVVGSLCTPKDRLSTQQYVESVRVGDILIFANAGAYGWNISHQKFLRHPEPRQVYING